MSKCKKCDRDITFMDVLKTPNPLKLKCGGCKEPVMLEKKSSVPVALVITALVLGAMYYFAAVQPVKNYWVYVVIPAVLAAEVFYYALIKIGVVKVSA